MSVVCKGVITLPTDGKIKLKDSYRLATIKWVSGITGNRDFSESWCAT